MIHVTDVVTMATGKLHWLKRLAFTAKTVTTMTPKIIKMPFP